MITRKTRRTKNVDEVKSGRRLILAITVSEVPAKDKKSKNNILIIIKQMLNEKEIFSVSWRPGKDPLDDCMSKQTATTFNLLSVFQSGRREGQ